MWNLRAVSAKALIVKFFCSFRAKYVGVPFPRALPYPLYTSFKFNYKSLITNMLVYII